MAVPEEEDESRGLGTPWPNSREEEARWQKSQPRRLRSLPSSCSSTPAVLATRRKRNPHQGLSLPPCGCAPPRSPLQCAPLPSSAAPRASPGPTWLCKAPQQTHPCQAKSPCAGSEPRLASDSPAQLLGPCLRPVPRPRLVAGASVRGQFQLPGGAGLLLSSEEELTWTSAR